MIDFFVAYLTNEKRASAHTIKSYQTDLKQFENFFASPIESAHLDDIRNWVIHLSENKTKNISINRKIASLKAFYRLLLQRKKIDSDPTILLKNLKTPKKLPVFYEEKITENLFDEIQYPNDFEGLRDKLILELFYGTGIRLSELIEIKENDVDLLSRTVKVLGKRNRYRIIPLHNNLISLIEEYLNVKNSNLNNDYLIVTDKRDPLYPVFVQRKVKFYIEQVSTIKKKSPHILRHTFATHLLNRGAELNAIKELLGHANLSATQIYTHNSFSKLKEIFERSHPKG